MATMKVIKSVEPGKAEIRNVPKLKVRDGYVLVKVKVVGVNPTDWYHHPTDEEVQVLSVLTYGCDLVGTVEEIGANVIKGWKVGDRIAGFAHGINAHQPEDGAFGEYALLKGDVGIKVPDNLSDEQAATLTLGMVTVGLGIYRNLKLPLPGTTPNTSPRMPFLIYGASSSTGTLAIQSAALSGFEVIAVCSERSFDAVRKLGASATFDYRHSDCGKQIRAHTNDKLHYAFDCISDETSARICCDAISSEGGSITTIGFFEYDRDKISSFYTYGYTHTGEDYTGSDGQRKQGIPEDFAFTTKYISNAEGLLASGKIVPHQHELGENGLDGVLDGLDRLRQGKVRGAKLVYRIADTPSLSSAA